MQYILLTAATIGEFYRVRSKSKFAFGPSGRPQITVSQENMQRCKQSIIPAIPPNQDLEYEVEVVSHEDYEADGMSSRDQCLSEVLLRKDCGNRWFSYGDFLRAGRAYSKGAETGENYLKSRPQSEDSMGEEALAAIKTEHEKDIPVITAYIACLNNLAACHISRADFLKAKEVRGDFDFACYTIWLWMLQLCDGMDCQLL